VARPQSRYFPSGLAGHNAADMARHLEAAGAHEAAQEAREYAQAAEAARAQMGAAELVYQRAYDAVMANAGSSEDLEAAINAMVAARADAALYGFAAAGVSAPPPTHDTEVQDD
jgi:hypothetical protein